MLTYTPKKTKHKKYHKGKRSNYISKYLPISAIKPKYFAVYSVESAQMSSKQIFTFYQSLNKYIKKSGKITMHLFAHLPKTKKPLEVRMGKGKGNVSLWIAKIKPGVCVCSINTLFPSIAIKAILYAKKKLPFKIATQNNENNHTL